MKKLKIFSLISRHDLKRYLINTILLQYSRHEWEMWVAMLLAVMDVPFLQMGTVSLRMAIKGHSKCGRRNIVRFVSDLFY